MRRHMNSVHVTSEIPYRCPPCNKEFRNKSYMKSHVKSNHVDWIGVDCSIFAVGYTDEARATFDSGSMDVKDAMESLTKHCDEGSICMICYKKYTSKGNMKRHMQNYHFGQK